MRDTSRRQLKCTAHEIQDDLLVMFQAPKKSIARGAAYLFSKRRVFCACISTNSVYFIMLYTVESTEEYSFRLIRCSQSLPCSSCIAGLKTGNRRRDLWRSRTTYIRLASTFRPCTRSRAVIQRSVPTQASQQLELPTCAD